MKTVRIILMLLLLFCTADALADAPPSQNAKREAITEALEKGILTPYDIPFNTYITLDMWEPADRILRQNFQNTRSIRLPGKYYSRPMVLGDRVWVFENGNDRGGEIYLFSPESLAPKQVLKDEAFNLHASGVRTLYKKWVISGGADEDVDRVIVWNIETGKITLLTLEAGHYISALAVENDRLYAGTCGGMVNVWQMDGLTPSGVYKATSEDISDWQVFNRQECIRRLFFFDDQVIGAGDRHIFSWDIESRERIKKIKKTFTNGNTCFFEGSLIEFKENRFAVRPLDRPDEIKIKKIKQPIDDLIVIREKVLPDQEGPVIALSARYNRGILFYDLETLDLMASTELRGESLSQYNGALFATDDRRLYRHDIRERDPENLERFLRGLSLEELLCTEEVYLSLVKRGEKYPQAIDLNRLGQWFMNGHGLSLAQKTGTGKIGHRQASGNKMGSANKAVTGCKLMYEINNTSGTPYYLRLKFQWPVRVQDKETDPETEPGFMTHYEELPVPPRQKSGSGIVVLGEAKPDHLWIYPERITPLPKNYYDQLMQALSPDHQDSDLVDRFLKDERVRRWHPELLLRKRQMEGE